MNRSLNEIDALAKRAARGAGLSWGMAEETGKATRWLAALDLAGPFLLADILTQNDGLDPACQAPAKLDGEWHASSGDLCPLSAGAALNDCADRLADGQSIEMATVSCPLLVLPFAAWAAIHIKKPVRVHWQDLPIDTNGYGIWVADPLGQIAAGRATRLGCQTVPERGDPPSLPGRRAYVTPEVWA